MTVEFEDILEDVGGWGRFQKYLALCFGTLVSVLAPFPGMSLIFMVMTPQHICHIPENVSLLYSQNNSCELLDISPGFPNGSLLNKSSTLGCIYGWQYNKDDFESTVATKWNLVCEYSYYPSFLLMLQNIGNLVGTPIYSALADRFGRKTLCFILMLLSPTLQLASAFVENLLLYAVLRTLVGTVLPTIYIISFILISEFMPPNKRVLVNGVYNFGWMAGMCLLPLVGYLSRNWIYFTIINSLLTALLLFFWRYVPESASWLISQKRYGDATKVMSEIGIKNNCVPKEGYLEMKLKELGEKKKSKKENNVNILTFLKYPRLRKHFIILTTCWISNTVAYFLLQYNVVNLAGNVFFNFFLLSIAEAPGNALCWLMMERFGRRWTTSIGCLGIAISCLLPLTGYTYASTASSVIGKLIASGVIMVIDQQGCELFPTSARSIGMGTGKSFASAALLFAPYFVYFIQESSLNKTGFLQAISKRLVKTRNVAGNNTWSHKKIYSSMYSPIIPFVFIGSLSSVSAVLSSFLPETLDENLPQTFLDADEFGRDHKYFSFKRKEKSSLETGDFSDEEKDKRFRHSLLETEQQDENK